ncbi:MAG: hypothetical protein ACK40O_08030 [Allosphingosinicella sp.]
MPKSRLTLSALALAMLSGPAAAQQAMTAEEVSEAFARTWPTVAKIDCPEAAEDEIVVCARPGRSPYRVDPALRGAGDRLPGESLRPADTLAHGSTRCSTVGPNQNCGGGLPIIPIALFLVDAAGKAIQALKED